MHRFLMSCVCLFVASASYLRAQESTSPPDRYLALEERIQALESEVSALKAALEAEGTAAAAAPLIVRHRQHVSESVQSNDETWRALELQAGPSGA